MFKKNKYFWQTFIWVTILGLVMIFLIDSNWYARATMVSNTSINRSFLIIIILVIAIFLGILQEQIKKDKH